MGLIKKIDNWRKKKIEKNIGWAVNELIKEKKSKIEDIYHWSNLLRYYRLVSKDGKRIGLNLKTYERRLNERNIMVN